MVAASTTLGMCLMLAASEQGLPPILLNGILSVEGGKVGEVSVNRDGSQDIGPFQINSRWIPSFAAAYGAKPAVVYATLRDDGCFNARVAGWILRQEIDRSPNLWIGVGRYHSPNPVKGEVYYRLVAERMALDYGSAIFAQKR